MSASKHARKPTSKQAGTHALPGVTPENVTEHGQGSVPAVLHQQYCSGNVVDTPCGVGVAVGVALAGDGVGDGVADGEVQVWTHTTHDHTGYTRQ